MILTYNEDAHINNIVVAGKSVVQVSPGWYISRIETYPSSVHMGKDIEDLTIIVTRKEVEKDETHCGLQNFL